MFLYHATTRAAADSIKEEGHFRCGKHGFAGGAIYFSSTQKAACTKIWNGRGGAEVVIRCEVDLGRTIDAGPNEVKSERQCKLLGGDSVKIRKKDVYAVYDHTRIKIVSFEDLFTGVSSELPDNKVMLCLLEVIQQEDRQQQEQHLEQEVLLQQQNLQRQAKQAADRLGMLAMRRANLKAAQDRAAAAAAAAVQKKEDARRIENERKAQEQQHEANRRQQEQQLRQEELLRQRNLERQDMKRQEDLRTLREQAEIRRQEEQQLICSICRDPLLENIQHLACSHKFHEQCVTGCLNISGGSLEELPCPECRRTAQHLAQAELELLRQQNLEKHENNCQGVLGTAQEQEAMRRRQEQRRQLQQEQSRQQAILDTWQEEETTTRCDPLAGLLIFFGLRAAFRHF